MTTIVVPTTDIQKRQRALFSRASDDVLFGAVSMLELKADSGTPLTAEENLTRAWILAEVEARYPQTDAAMEAWADSDAPARTYSAHLFAEVGRIKAERAAQDAARAESARKERRERARATLAAAHELTAKVRATAERYPGRVLLQRYGWAPAIPAGDIVADDVLMLNGGTTETVTSVEPKGTASVLIRTGPADWQVRTCRRSTLVAIAYRSGDDD